jgi:hypothetical protein
MPRTGTFLEAVTSYYSNLAFGALEAMRTTQEDLRTNTFQLSKTLGNVVSLYLDATEGWWNALLVTASAPLPTGFLRIGPLGGTDTCEIRVLVPQEPEFTGLVRIGGGELIEGITINRLKNGDGLEVKLKGLDRERAAGRLKPGLYQGLVHIGDKPLAVLMLRVDAGAAPAAAPDAGNAPAKKKPAKKK